VSDKLFHKRKARKKDSLARKKASRKAYDRVLIVCEDGKSSPAYLKDLCAHFRLNTANVEICGDECGSAPISVVNFAKTKARQDGDFDRVFCVIDVDSHGSLAKAKDKARRSRPKIELIITNPCFEFWLLLHFQYSTKPYGPSGKHSPCDCVIKDLRQQVNFENYEKGQRGIFGSSQDKLLDAVNHAKRLSEHNQRAATDNPSTGMHKLISYLQHLKS